MISRPAASRRITPAVISALLLFILIFDGCRSIGPAPTSIKLRTSPKVVYKAADPGHEDTESCTFNVIVSGAATAPLAAQLLVRTGERALETISVAEDGLRAHELPVPPNSSFRAYRFTIRTPRKDSFDNIRITLGSGKDQATLLAPVLVYQQKTKLIFPFKGRGLVTSGAVNDGGHRNGSGQFAIDVVALNESYAPISCGEDRNECSVGFGTREIIAPAAGTVIRAWAGFADNVEWGGADAKRFTLPDGTIIDTGNSVIIDHGDGEYSVIAHMKKDSIAVREGQRVEQGDRIGLLGNSGESYGPHVHYQLQDGIDLQRATGLPTVFENHPQQLIRGSYFNAK